MKTNEMQLLRSALRRLRVDAIRAAWRVAIAGSRGETSQAALNCNSLGAVTTKVWLRDSMSSRTSRTLRGKQVTNEQNSTLNGNLDVNV